MNDNLPPCGIEEIIYQVFNFDNLKKYIEYLEMNSARAFNQINECKLKLLEIDEIKTNLNEINTRLDIFTNKFHEVEQAISFQQIKILEVERKSQGHEEKIIEIEKISSELGKTVNGIDENVKNLNKVTEENCRSIEKLNVFHENLRSITEVHSNKIETHEKNLSILNNEVAKISELETTISQHINKSKTKFSKLKKFNSEQTIFNNGKFQEIDSNLNKLFTHVSDFISQLPNPGMKDFNSNQTKKEDSSLNLINLTNSKNSDAFYKEFTDFRTKVDDEIKTLKYKAKLKLKVTNNDAANRNTNDPNDIDNLNNQNTILNQDLFKPIDISSLNNPNSSINNQFIIASINQLQENDKLVLQNLTYKVSRDELEKLQRLMGMEIERVMNKVTESLIKNDEKYKRATETAVTQVVDRNEIKNILQDVGKDIFSDEIGKIIFEQLEKNDFLKETFSKTQSNAEEIHRLYESIVELRRITIDDKNNSSSSDKDKKEIITRISDLELLLKHLRNQFDENIKGVESLDNNEENEKESQPASIRDYIRHVAGNLKVLGEKFEKLQARQENLNIEILNKVKKDLGTESNRILEEFRGDLKNSIGKVEDQLREKVDRMNLDEFGRRFDNKLVNEISKKMDKNDLKKNNTYLNKKIDHLENKISKTLVDTLIDLQMEEAPLIVKKSIMGDKCGSCNQVLLNQANSSIAGNYHIHVPQSNSVNFGMNYNGVSNNNNMIDENNNTRYKLRTIQDNSNKYGTGSYSRILTNINAETLNDDLKPGMKNYMNSTSVHLPGINKNTNDKRKLNDVTPPRIRNKVNNSRNNQNMTNNNSTNYNNTNLVVTHDSEKIMSSVINEELEKKYINPENLIKASNKFVEGNANVNNVKSLK